MKSWPARAWKYRELILRLAIREIAQRFRTSRLGGLWLLIHPLALMLTFYFVFAVIFQNRWRSPNESRGEFILALFAGLLMFNVFSEIVGRSPSLVVGNVNYVKKVVFPLDILPLVAALSALANWVVGACIWMVFFVLVRESLPPSTALAAPILLLPIVLYAIGTTWILSSLCVYFRDIGQAIPLVLQAMIFFAPVLYPLDRVPDGVLRGLLLLNPLSVPIESLRLLCLDGGVPGFMNFIGSFVGSIALAHLGHAFFVKMRAGFADVL